MTVGEIAGLIAIIISLISAVSGFISSRSSAKKSEVERLQIVIETLEHRIAELTTDNDKLRNRVDELEKENDELRRELGKKRIIRDYTPRQKGLSLEDD